MTETKDITLAIEAAISGGSLSLLRGDVEIAGWIGESNLSKAEDLLFNIDLLLRENGVSKNDIDLIAVSAGPGSFTGIRIGIATALGLKAGLGIEMSSQSALGAMAFAYELDGDVTVALPVGRNAVCIQTFGARTICPDVSTEGPCRQSVRAAIGEPNTVTEEEFYTLIGSDTSAKFLIHEHLHKKVNVSSNAINFGLNLANAVGRVCRADRSVCAPLFISKSF